MAGMGTVPAPILRIRMTRTDWERWAEQSPVSRRSLRLLRTSVYLRFSSCTQSCSHGFLIESSVYRLQRHISHTSNSKPLLQAEQPAAIRLSKKLSSKNSKSIGPCNNRHVPLCAVCCKHCQTLDSSSSPPLASACKPLRIGACPAALAPGFAYRLPLKRRNNDGVQRRHPDSCMRRAATPVSPYPSCLKGPSGSPEFWVTRCWASWPKRD
jgi:hypothetical protein